MPWTREDVDQTMMVLSHTLTATAGGAIVAIDTDHEVFGMVVQMRIVDGGTVPTDLWDLTIVDATGTSAIISLGDNLATASNPHFFNQATDFQNGVAVDGLLTLSAANMGNAGQATVTLYIVRMGL